MKLRESQLLDSENLLCPREGWLVAFTPGNAYPGCVKAFGWGKPELSPRIWWEAPDEAG